MGCATLGSGTMVETHLSGPATIVPGYSSCKTTDVIYCLCGGIKAQKCFIEHQISTAAKRLDLSFSSHSSSQIPLMYFERDGYRPLAREEIFWTAKSNF